MAENSKIEWCDHTYNPWIGCTKVSPGCVNCYAAVSTRARVLRANGQETWGKGAERSKTKTAGDPIKWNRDFQKAQDFMEGQLARPRVFCASLSDWLDDEIPIDWLRDLLVLIEQTPNLDWLLLTKRPQNFAKRVEEVANLWQSSCELAVWWMRGVPPQNVWIGTTVEDQQRADERIPALLSIPACVRFLSCEPLLGELDITDFLWQFGCTPHCGERCAKDADCPMEERKNHWVICGGESGKNARPMHPDWARALRDQCAGASMPFLFKQWGEWQPVTPLYEGRDEDAEDGRGNLEIINQKGQIWDERDGQPSCNGSWLIEKVGKNAAGRILDGVEHNGFPQP